MKRSIISQSLEYNLCMVSVVFAVTGLQSVCSLYKLHNIKEKTKRISGLTRAEYFSVNVSQEAFLENIVNIQKATSVFAMRYNL